MIDSHIHTFELEYSSTRIGGVSNERKTSSRQTNRNMMKNSVTERLP